MGVGESAPPGPDRRPAWVLRPFPGLGLMQNVAWIAAAAMAVGLLSAAYRALEVVASGSTRPLLHPFVEELTGAAGVALLIPAVVGAARRWPLFERHGWRHVPVQLFVLLVFGVVGTSWMWLSRSLLFPCLGLGPYDYGIMPVRYLMELPKQVLIFGIILVVTALFDRQDAARRHQLQLSRMETALAQAQLSALHAQLRPHFLFNALNTVSSVMYEDVEKADRMLTLLSDLLRWSLSASDAGMVPLRSEIDATHKFLELMRARFGERLTCTLHVDPATADALVPALLLQPLVENAAEHGMPQPPAVGCIAVSVSREGRHLVLAVEDNGPGPNGGRGGPGRGVGLRNTVARLHSAYGPDARLDLEQRASGGTRATVRVPYLERAAAAVPE